MKTEQSIIGRKVRVARFDIFFRKNIVDVGEVEGSQHNSVTGETFFFVRVKYPCTKVVKVPKGYIEVIAEHLSPAAPFVSA